MSYNWFSLVLASLAAALILAPPTTAVPGQLLSKLLDKTICRSEVSYNINENRIPHIIKEVKCAASPDTMCTVDDGEKSCCEHNSYGNVAFSCKEILDNVVVSYTSDPSETSTEKVSVGCACVRHQTITAEEV